MRSIKECKCKKFLDSSYHFLSDFRKQFIISYEKSDPEGHDEPTMSEGAAKCKDCGKSVYFEYDSFLVPILKVWGKSIP
jgi:hypothetical protein